MGLGVMEAYVEHEKPKSLDLSNLFLTLAESPDFSVPQFPDSYQGACWVRGCCKGPFLCCVTSGSVRFMPFH